METSTIHTQQFALKWNNFHSNLSSGFHELFEAAEMVDVTLAVDGKFLQAHKVVLSICSPYFKEMFKVNPCKHPIVILKDVGHEHMKDILEFMYLGEVSVLRENLASFLRTAELLQVKGLTGDDSSESSKEEEKIDCENDDEEEYSNMMRNMQYNSIDNQMTIPPHYSNPTSVVRNPTPPPPISQHTKVPSLNIPQQPNNKRSSKNFNSGGGNGKRTKTDNNANQSIFSKSVPMSLVKEEDEIVSQIRKSVSSNHDSEPEYTDISYMKSERSSLDEDSLEKHIVDKSSTAIDSSAEQDMLMFSGDSKPYVYCPYCERKFVNRYNLKVHVRDKHEDSTINLDCDVCGKTMRNRSCLRVHMYHHRKQVELSEQPDTSPN
ncbi:hypothetical protein HHI36_019042 [Cryptolaemus montrouzieri]|uniref:Uncharacterized protein n=1 Tax=Cryptolaemus montrouzieri TaxID=559131 RepID=A0ABD2P1R7_9CUCU